ncbi:MAG: hypothetical protein GDA42_09875 [Ekhidna sp.]|nr:hypothetical protein [Ekhidna sp.]
MRVPLITMLTCLALCGIKAQTSVSFNNLGNATFQNNYQNPALIPSEDLFIGIPVISGIHVHINTKTSYNETFTNEGNTTLIDINKILENLQRQNMVSAHVGINLFHVGVKTKNKSLISLSGRERLEIDLLYSRQLIDYIWNGNEQFTNRSVKISKAGIKGMHFREFGVGYATPINEKMNLGARAKFLVGFADVSLPGNFSANLESNSEVFQLENTEVKNFALRTSGLNIYKGNEGNLGSHLLMNSNTGFGLDLGLSYYLSRAYTLTASLLDVGFINWKEDNESDVISNDTSFDYKGVSLDQLGTVRQTIQDSLIDRFNTTKNFDPYKGWLPLKGYASWIYHYNRNTDIYFSGGTRLVQRRLKMLYGIGVTQKFGPTFTGNITATKLPQQFVNLGASFAVKVRAVQMYMAADQVVNFSVPDAKAFDFRFGINLAIGTEQDGAEDIYGKRKIPGAKGLDTNAFLGKKIKTKKREGIYSIIKKQRKRELKNKRTKRDNTVEKKSLNGRSGKKNTDED